MSVICIPYQMKFSEEQVVSTVLVDVVLRVE